MSRQHKKRRKKKARINKLRASILIVGLIVFVGGCIFGATSIVNIFKTADKNLKKEVDQEVAVKQYSLDDESSNKQYKIVVDAGHGGNDVGTTGHGGMLEKDIDLTIAKKVASKLSKYDDIEVIMSRNDDVYSEPKDRAHMANNINADILVSIHGNAESGGSTANGIETYYYTKAGEDSKKLAKLVQDTLCLYVEARDRGSMPNNYEVLREANMTAILVEVGFLTNPKEEEQLSNKKYQDQLAEGIVQGILSYLDEN